MELRSYRCHIYYCVGRPTARSPISRLVLHTKYKWFNLCQLCSGQQLSGVRRKPKEHCETLLMEPFPFLNRERKIRQRFLRFHEKALFVCIIKRLRKTENNINNTIWSSVLISKIYVFVYTSQPSFHGEQTPRTEALHLPIREKMPQEETVKSFAALCFCSCTRST